MSNNTEFPETFDISRFIPDMEFNDIIDKFENGRTPDKILKHKNKVLTVEEFEEETKKTTPQKMSKDELKEYLEKLEKQIEEEHIN